MKKTVFLLLFIYQGVVNAQNCNCDSNFQWLKSYIERNYPGFKAKVNTQTLDEYNANIKKYGPLIKQAEKPAYCQYYLLKWLEFFKDKHIQMGAINDNGLNTDKDTEQIMQLDKTWETLGIDSSSFIKKLTVKNSSGIEGIYMYDDSTYTIAIIKNKNVFRDYAGVILNSKTKFWRKGEVKIELKQLTDSTYAMIQYMRNHTTSIFRRPVIFSNGEFKNFRCNRIIPAPKAGTVKEAPPKKEEGDNLNTYYKNISIDISYLRIYSFDDSYRHEIDSVVKANMGQIKKHKDMILDLRWNGGGSDGSYQSLMPIVYSNRVVDIGVDIYSTPDNIIAIKRMMKEDAQYWSKGDMDWMDSLITVMNTHPYQFVNHNDDDTIKFDSVMLYPQKVAILINRFCGSTTEQFLLYAKDCKKVILMGENSGGVLDYSNIRPVDFPSLPVTLYYPVTLSRRVALHQGIDGVGIPPNVRLSPNEDWVKEAESYLLKN